MPEFKFGPKNGVDSKDYILYMEGDLGVTDRPINLLGHSVGSPSVNLVEALIFTDVVFAGGVVKAVERVKRSATESSRTYSIGIPSSLLTPVSAASYENGCSATFFLIYLCPEDPIYNHFDILPDGNLAPATEAEDIITTGTDTNIITQTSELRVPMKIRGWAVGFDIVYTGGATVALNDIAFNKVDCINCNEGAGLKLAVVGGDGTAIPAALRTVDRFATVTTETTGAAAADIGQSIFTEGNLKLVATRTGATLGAATAGALYISLDNGATYAAVSGVTQIFTRIIRVGNVLIGGGKNATTSYIAISSDNGASWAPVTSALLATGDIIQDISYDPDTQRIYFVGTGSVFLVGRLNGATLSLTDLFANMSGAPTALYAVALLGKNNLLVGGASGFLSESRDGGLTFTRVIPGGGSTDSVLSIAGNQYRAIIAQGGNLYKRDALTRNQFERVVLENGASLVASSVIQRVVVEPWGGINRFAASTNKGQVIFGKPYYPGA